MPFLSLTNKVIKSYNNGTSNNNENDIKKNIENTNNKKKFHNNKNRNQIVKGVEITNDIEIIKSIIYLKDYYDDLLSKNGAKISSIVQLIIQEN